MASGEQTDWDPAGEGYYRATCAWAPSGRVVAVVFADREAEHGEVRLHSGQAPLALLGRFACDKGVLACAFTEAEDRPICMEGGDNLVECATDPLRRERAIPYRHSSRLFACACAPGDRFIVTGDLGGQVCLWDPATYSPIVETEVQEYRRYFPSINCCAVSPDGRLVFTGTWGCTLIAWAHENGPSSQTSLVHSDGVSACAVSPDGELVATTTVDGCVHLARLDGTALTHIGPPGRHEARVECCAFHPGGGCFIIGSGDKNLRVWEASAWTAESSL